MTDPLQQYDDLVRGRMLAVHEFGVEVRQPGVTVRIAVGEYLKDDPALATLVFDGVIGLKFEQALDGFPLGIQIIADDSGWENVMYKVTDPEYGITSFWSAEFHIETPQ